MGPDEEVPAHPPYERLPSARPRDIAHRRRWAWCRVDRAGGGTSGSRGYDGGRTRPGSGRYSSTGGRGPPSPRRERVIWPSGALRRRVDGPIITARYPRLKMYSTGRLWWITRGSPPGAARPGPHPEGGQSSAIACPAVLSLLKGWLWLLPGQLGSRACSAPLTSPRPDSASEGYQPHPCENYGKEGRQDRFHPVLRRNPPIFKARLETLRIISASDPPCENNVPQAGVLGANQLGAIRGVNISQIPRPGAIEGVKRAYPLRRTGASTLHPIRYRRFSHRWGCYPHLWKQYPNAVIVEMCEK